MKAVLLAALLVSTLLSARAYAPGRWVPAPKTPKVKDVPPPRKNRYLDEEWSLSWIEEQKESGYQKESFPRLDAKAHPPVRSGAGAGEHFPQFKLMYQLREATTDAIDAAHIAEHKGYCDKFNRLLSCEVLRTDKGAGRGVVMLFVGLARDDIEGVEVAATREELLQFLEGDPLIAGGLVEEWDVLDLHI
ncbi:hypothetical protein B484DRAFT_448605 [Ochromonadaceae sp. CCMP2298]|nr:hypothetical protein B484DRAFT_448605 [Ochromonadaceae sp. CCMP2298]|mmetsp:Transcript_20807/g.46341  ORF Transcript_20807/g.46341 Transcript_20807/m.46341 type:complete len:190 (+) Transcript_20807:153-722(+)